jgi:hypothetical protein
MYSVVILLRLKKGFLLKHNEEERCIENARMARQTRYHHKGAPAKIWKIPCFFFSTGTSKYILRHDFHPGQIKRLPLSMRACVREGSHVVSPKMAIVPFSLYV